MLEGFAFHTKTLDLHLGPEIMCVKETGVCGLGCRTPPEIADPRSRAWAWEVHVASMRDDNTMLLLRPASALRAQEDTSGDGTGRGAESCVTALPVGWSSSLQHLMLFFLKYSMRKRGKEPAWY